MYVLSHPTIMFRYEAQKSINSYDRNSSPNIDMDFYIRLKEKGNFANLNDCISSIRLHETSFTHKNLYQIIKQRYLLPKRNLISKKSFHWVNIRLQYLAAMYYRLGIIKYINSQSYFWIFWLAVASLLDLKRTIFYLKNKLVNYNETIS